MAACQAAQEAAAAAAEEKARLLTELQQARAALDASADGSGASRDAESAYLAAQLKVPFLLMGYVVLIRAPNNEGTHGKWDHVLWPAQNFYKPMEPELPLPFQFPSAYHTSSHVMYSH